MFSSVQAPERGQPRGGLAWPSWRKGRAGASRLRPARKTGQGWRARMEGAEGRRREPWRSRNARHLGAAGTVGRARGSGPHGAQRRKGRRLHCLPQPAGGADSHAGTAWEARPQRRARPRRRGPAWETGPAWLTGSSRAPRTEGPTGRAWASGNGSPGARGGARSPGSARRSGVSGASRTAWPCRREGRQGIAGGERSRGTHGPPWRQCLWASGA